MKKMFIDLKNDVIKLIYIRNKGIIIINKKCDEQTAK